MAVVWKKLAFEDDVVTKALFDADTFLYATNDNTPVATSPADVLAALSGHAAAEFLMNTQKIGGVVDPATDQQVATKKYVDDQVLTVNTFLELTDTPGAYAGEGGKLVVVNATPDALEFVAITTFLEGAPTEDLATKAPTSEWAFDHNAKKAANAVLGHVMVEDASLIDVDGDGKLTLGAHASTHENGGGDEISAAGLSGLLADDQHVLDTEVTSVIEATPLNNLAAADGAVDFNLQEATDLVVMKVADAATREALAAGATEVGQLIWQTDTGELYACVTSEV
ncbi:hypothetical protein ES703_16979 [subsurface metagenome]